MVSLLFSYGTLQQEAVQRRTFGRQLYGTPDELIGFILAEVRIDSQVVVAASGKPFHPIAKFTGSRSHRVPGTVYALTDNELDHADRYEVAAYRRIKTTLGSGKVAWAYVEAVSSSVPAESFHGSQPEVSVAP
ncbi:MAG: gamma-glutamylcyclotransferase family protein [Cyanobacteriota bacterium]